MNITKIILGLALILMSISLISAEGEQITGDTVFIDNKDCYISVSPHTLTESGYIDVTIKSKGYTGLIDIEYGFNKMSAKPKTFEHNPVTLKEGETPSFDNIVSFDKAENRIYDGKHLWYTDKTHSIDTSKDIRVRVWVDADYGSSGKYDIVVRTLNGLWVLDPWWSVDASIVDGLTDVGNYGLPGAFVMDGIPYLLCENNVPTTYGFNLSANTWQVDDDIKSGWNPASAYNNPYIFENNSIWYLISGRQDGEWSGFNWTGSAWQTDSDIISGLTDIGDHGKPVVFFKDSIHYLISGNFAGTWNGFNWTGSVWQQDDNIILGLPDVGAKSDPAIFQKNGIWYLIAGSNGGGFTGFQHNGTGWESDTNLVSGMDAYDTYSSPCILDYQGLHVISGFSDGTWKGWSSFMINYPINLDQTNTYTSVNWTWNDSTDSYNTLDSYNVSINNVWHNTTLNQYYNHTGLTPGGESSIIVWGYNNSYGISDDNATGSAWTGDFNYTDITGIHGIVYEGLPGSTTTISNVVVQIYNTTWSDTTVSNIHGYYAFTNLTNNTYTVSFSKDRYSSVYATITPVDKEMFYKEINLQLSESEYYKRHYVTFTLKSIWQTRYSNVAVVVYDNGDTEGSGVTGSDGSITFHLLEDLEYRITFINATQGINKEISLYPADNEYTIYVETYDMSPDSTERGDTVNWWYQKGDLNLTHGWLNFSYRDTANETTFIEYWINDSDNANLFYTNQTYPCSGGNDYTSNNIVNASNHTYIVHFSAVHPDYPELNNSGIQTISYYIGKLIDLGFSEQWHYTVTAISIIFFIAMLAGATNIASIGVIVCLTAWFFSFIQWLPSSTIGYASLVLATILAVAFAMRKAEVVHA